MTLSTLFYAFFCIRPSPGLLPVLEQLERYMTPTLDAALLSSSRAGAYLDGIRTHRGRIQRLQLNVQPPLYLQSTMAGFLSMLYIINTGTDREASIHDTYFENNCIRAVVPNLLALKSHF